MFGRKQPQVLISGAGPVGLFTALHLARRGVRVQIVDKEWQTTSRSYALALHPRSLELFDEVGLLDELLAHSRRIQTVGLYDMTSRRAELDMQRVTEDFAFLAVSRQDQLESLLEEALAAEGVKVQWNHQVRTVLPEDDDVLASVARLEKESMGYSVAHMEWVVAKTIDLHVPYVVGADGHRSFVRRAAHIPLEEVGPEQHYAVFEFETDADLGTEMRLSVGDDTLDVLWPLPDGRCRWSFELREKVAPQSSRTKDRLAVHLGSSQYPVLREEHLRELIDERAPWFDGHIGEIDWRILVRFERRLAQSFGHDRIRLVGDAAHMTAPAGIQSMNVGLLEARDLANTLADVLLDGALPDRIAACGRRWHAEWRRLLGLDARLAATDSTDPWIAQHANRLLPCLPASGEQLTRLAQQLGLHMDSALAEPA